jgi:hypothetical protein
MLTFAPSTRAVAGATNVASQYGVELTYSPAGHLLLADFSGLAAPVALRYTRDAKGRATQVESFGQVGGVRSWSILTAEIVHDADDRITSARYGNNT